DGARVLDAREVLDRTRDADRDVQLGGDDLAGLSDLHLVGCVTGVHGGARSPYRGTQLVRQAVEDLEALGAAERAATGHHPPGGLQIRAVAPGGRHRHEARV